MARLIIPTTLPRVPEKRYSPRYLSADERVHLADLRQERRTMRDIAALMGFSLSTISGGAAAPASSPASAPGRPGATRRPARRHDPDPRPIVERTTRFTLLGHLPGRRHDSATVRDAVLAALADMPPHLRRTLTWDQGSEMARHTEIAAALGTTGTTSATRTHRGSGRPTRTPTACCAPTSPRSTDLSVHTADDIALVQLELNRRPRKVLGWDSPADGLATLLR